MGKVIEFSGDGRPVVPCEKCGCQEFYIIADRFGGWNAIEGTECIDCGNIVDWIKVTLDDD
jgi:predicted nucleic-acid-binding Zn-ribbon protein